MEGPPSSTGRAPSHGGASSANPFESSLRRPRKKRAEPGGVREVGVKVGRRERMVSVETKLERENTHLKEQLKFQGAVLDQLARDVHTLECKAAAGTETAHFRPSPTHPQGAGDDEPYGQAEVLPDVQQVDVQQVDTAGAREEGCHDERGRIQDARTGCENVHAAREVLRGEPSEHDDTGESCSDNNQKGAASQPLRGGSSGMLVSSTSTPNQQGATLRGGPVKSLYEGPENPSAASPEHIRPPKDASLALPLQPRPALAEKEEEPAENAQLRFDLRETRRLAEAYRRRFAAARKTAEEKEQSHVDLLARERKFRAAVEAGLGEKVHNTRRRARDREEKLSAELSSVKTQLRETVDLLTTKEEEVCSARTREVQQEARAAATLAKFKERDRHASWLERRLEEISSEEAAVATLRLQEMTTTLETQQRELTSLRAFVRETTGVRKRHHQEQETDPREMDRREKSQHDVNSSTNRYANRHSSALTEGFGDTWVSVAPNVTAASETHEVNVALERGAVIPDVDRPTGSPAEGTSTVVHTRKNEPKGDPTGDPTGDPVGDPVENPVGDITGDDAAEDTRGDDPVGDVDDDPKVNPKNNEPLPESHCCNDADECPARPIIQKTRLHSDSDRGESPTVTSPLGGVNPLKWGSEIVSSTVQGTNFKDKKMDDKKNSDGGGAWRTRATVDDGAEEELWARIRLCEEERRGWEKESEFLRVERQEMLRRLRKLAHEAHEKDQVTLKLQKAVRSLESDLAKSREARISLQRQLRQRFQASRLLEKRAKSAEGLLSEAVALKAKAERAKTLLKARLAAVSWGCERSDSVWAKARPASAAGGDGSRSSSIHGRSRCGGVDRGYVIPHREARLPFRLGTSSATDSRAAGSAEESGKQPLVAVNASLDQPPLIRKQQQRQQAQTLPVDGPEERYLVQERDSPRNRDGPRPDLGQEQRKLEKKRQPHGEEAELEEIQKEMERQRRNFGVERQVLERKRQESSLAAQNAEHRAGKLKAAWQALAEKVLSLAGRNADLEWALLRLRRESSSAVTNRYVCDHSGIPPSPVRTSTVAHHQQELGGSVSSDDISIDHNGGGDGDDDYNNKHFVDHDEPGNDSDRPFIACSILHCDQGDENNTRGRDHDSGGASRREDDNAGVARVSLSFEALFDEHQAAAGTGQARAVAAEDGGQGNGSDVESR